MSLDRLPTALAALLSLGLAACASVPATTSPGDPFEPANRIAYAIHEPIDRDIVKPIAKAWSELPRGVRGPFTNFFNNIEDLFSGINGLLQNKPEKAGHDFGRVVVNTFAGLGGLLDFASDAGIPRGEEDFGQTMGFYGIETGPYLFIPLFGPTTVRDGTGFLVRATLTPYRFINEWEIRTTLLGFNYVEGRAQALEAQTLAEKAALDPYTFIRRSYLQRREYLVYDGKPPRKDDE